MNRNGRDLKDAEDFVNGLYVVLMVLFVGFIILTFTVGSVILFYNGIDDFGIVESFRKVYIEPFFG